MLYSIDLEKKETFYSEYAGEDMVDLLGDTFKIPTSYPCNVVPVDPGLESRMDLISYEAYGDDMYADLIHHLNGPSNPFEITEDSYIILPGLDRLDDFYKDPSESWSESKISNAGSRPKAKTKNEKRKPNEAVIGDRRFNIDTQSKIIVY